MNNKKLNVHMVQHTHWDREWYFTSDDSRTMLYYDMKFLIEYLENHDDKFTFDGQSSIIDDFLKFSPDWEDRFKRVVKDGKILIGPFYTQTDNVLPNGESIIRNIEIGNAMAKKIGHSMQVGYLPDTFGHNNQTPQILRLNGIDNFSFYRGLDPEDTNDTLYFTYKGLDGSEVLGHWQTHYSTKGGAFDYTLEAFDKNIVSDYEKPGEFSPSVKSYAKRNHSLPIAIPVGSDQKPFRKEVKNILKDLNKKYIEFNFIASDYETMIKEIVKDVKENKIELPIIQTELRQALTGRVHRSVLSSRMDIKQLIFELETLLIDTFEPLSILCTMNGIDVPWKIIEHSWKELFKSSAHDSYGTTNEDFSNLKLKSRLVNAIRTSNGAIAMLTRIYANSIIKEKKDAYNKLILFNFLPKKYSGIYQFTTTVKSGFENNKFKIFDDKKEITYSILKRNNVGTHERDALTLLINVEDVAAFSHKLLSIKYFKNKQYNLTQKDEISKNGVYIQVKNNTIIINNSGKISKNMFKVAMDPSVGDTYDHSPITHNDKKYLLNNYDIIETNKEAGYIKFKASGIIPTTKNNWENNIATEKQELTIQLTIVNKNIHAKIIVQNNIDDGRMILIVDSFSDSEAWKHDQQFGTYKRNIHNKYMDTWKKPNKYGYKWDEYPTNLSPHQSFITNNESNFTIYTKGTKEHELIKYNNKNQFAITLYRAFGVFGRSKFLYRPGRGSGAHTDAPDCQMKNDVLEFDFIFVFSKVNEYQQFEYAKQLANKTFYIPRQWGLDRTILRWDTNIDYYDKTKKRGKKLDIPQKILNNNFISTALYKDPNNRIIARFLNLGKEIIIPGLDYKISRNVVEFKNKDVSVPTYGLINVWIRED
ncbi:hypothetical protein [Candidatus Mycoplasma mahonii]|uniref:glycoside hydrolase family 38 N-terminal domain-containing protein n=1 Tax=Candidatus Mycoplasma mahonii TaxID=3004105 RepID=UPI0026F1A33B|nr:hypothetical protein [Candidatus Mycoplasma mahonii]WKX02635.1 hypothetical protein O3I44_00970 [Candidatus Mycoplasma mahonii]